MKNKLLLILSVFTLCACGNEAGKNVYQTKGGEYASKIGNFVADFPTEPNYTAINNQIGLEKFQIHLFRSSLGPHKIFNLEYFDYPKQMIQSISNEDFFKQGVANYANKMTENFDLVFQEPVEQNGLNGRAFQLELNQTAKNKGLDGFIMGRIFRDGNRVYTVTYVGIDDNRVGSFLESFRLLR